MLGEGSIMGLLIFMITWSATWKVQLFAQILFLRKEHKDQSFQSIFLRKFKKVKILITNIALMHDQLVDAVHSMMLKTYWWTFGANTLLSQSLEHFTPTCYSVCFPKPIVCVPKPFNDGFSYNYVIYLNIIQTVKYKCKESFDKKKN